VVNVRDLFAQKVFLGLTLEKVAKQAEDKKSLQDEKR